MRARCLRRCLIQQPLVVIQVHVVYDFTECFIAHLSPEVDHQGLLLILSLLEKLSEVCRLMRNYALMCSDLDLRDKYFFFLTPVPLRHMRDQMCDL